MDGIGIRDAMLEIGERLATYGYFVLLPDLFYRSGPYAPMNAKTGFADPVQRKTLMEKFFAPATLTNLMSDTYPAKHGWVLRDTPVYDAEAAERHWTTLVALLDAKLK